MWAGRPILASNCKPKQDLINKTNCGEIFLSEDVQDLIDKLVMIKNLPDRGKEMGNNGRRVIEEQYRLKAYGKAFANFITANH